MIKRRAYRIDDYECYDNVGLWMNQSCLQFFNSTVAPSILEFYPQVDVKRDVRSEPSLDLYALRGLLGVKYTVTPVTKAAEFEEKAGAGWARFATEGQLAVYENQNALPLVYAYDSYVIQEDYEQVAKSQRAALLMRAVVLSEEQRQQYGGLLTELSELDRGELTRERYAQDLTERQAMAAWDVQKDNWGLSARITLERDNLVVFAVPYDPGFTAAVNGQPAQVLKVSGGLMAVPAPAGENQIRLDYHTQGLNQSLLVAAVCLVLWLAYIAANMYKKRKNNKLYKIGFYKT